MQSLAIPIARRSKGTAGRTTVRRNVNRRARTYLLIYVAGPYSADPERCTNQAIDAAERLRRAGFVPVVPHLLHFWHLRHPLPYAECMRIDLALLDRCDALLRLPGTSPGADLEVRTMRHKRRPVFRSFDALCRWAPGLAVK